MTIDPSGVCKWFQGRPPEVPWWAKRILSSKETGGKHTYDMIYDNIRYDMMLYNIILYIICACPGGRLPPSFIPQVGIIIITGLKKLYDCMFSP